MFEVKMLRLTDEERISFIEILTNEFGIEVEIARAFFKIESNEQAFCQNDNPLIRFEPHVFADPKRLIQFGVNAIEVPWAADTKYEMEQKWFALGFRHGTDCSTNYYEYSNLDFACQINEELAYQSTSIGIAQIMGFNCNMVGYSTAKQMFLEFMKSEESQIKGFFKFIEKRSGGKLLEALREKDFITAARYYNGVGNEQKYGAKLEKYYLEYKGVSI